MLLNLAWFPACARLDRLYLNGTTALDQQPPPFGKGWTYLSLSSVLCGTPIANDHWPTGRARASQRVQKAQFTGSHHSSPQSQTAASCTWKWAGPGRSWAMTGASRRASHPGHSIRHDTEALQAEDSCILTGNKPTAPPWRPVTLELRLVRKRMAELSRIVIWWRFDDTFIEIFHWYSLSLFGWRWCEGVGSPFLKRS